MFSSLGGRVDGGGDVGIGGGSIGGDDVAS